MNKDKEVILGYLKWLANRLSASMATQLNGADVDEYLEQQVNSVDLGDVVGLFGEGFRIDFIPDKYMMRGSAKLIIHPDDIPSK